MCTPFESVNDCFAPKVLEGPPTPDSNSLTLLKEGRDITKKTDLTTDNHSDASKQVKAVHHFGDGPTEERITTSVDGTMMPKESTNHDDSAGIITAMVYKESIDTQVGIGLKGNANKNLYISSIADGGLFASTDASQDRSRSADHK